MTQSPGDRFARLVDIMRTLRSPEGCPWDREQTLQTLAPFVLEETYEVLDAIERHDLGALKEEVGDLLFEGVFLAQVASDHGAFTVADALQTVADKLVRRHPHVFQEDGNVHDAASKERAPSATAALERWESQKARERTKTGQPAGALAGLPGSLPALLRAFKIGKRAAAVGFDWQHTTDVVAKVEEEVAELRDAVTLAPSDRAHIEEEMGDLLFALANLCRKLGIEPEAALRRANDKFTTRFNEMERRFVERDKRLEELTLAEMEAEWVRVKHDTTKTP
ncbi:MAG TPA: nucleoside triphosphate pyrophosphohydrolase [Vicinamibacterales bacterium]|jgi:MazG family protein